MHRVCGDTNLNRKESLYIRVIPPEEISSSLLVLPDLKEKDELEKNDKLIQDSSETITPLTEATIRGTKSSTLTADSPPWIPYIHSQNKVSKEFKTIPALEYQTDELAKRRSNPDMSHHDQGDPRLQRESEPKSMESPPTKEQPSLLLPYHLSLPELELNFFTDLDETQELEINFFADVNKAGQNSVEPTQDDDHEDEKTYSLGKQETELSQDDSAQPRISELDDLNPEDDPETVPADKKLSVDKPYGGKYRTVYLCTDGGSRCSDSVASTGWVLYNSKWNLILGRGKFLTSGTNNDAEMLAALDGIEYVMSSKRNSRIIHLTDSKLVEGGITGNTKLNAKRHQDIRRKILSLQGKNGNFILSYQLPREANSGADRMCNLSMDASKTTYQFDVSSQDIEEDRLKTRAHVEQHLLTKLMHYGEAAMLIHNNRYRMVMKELEFKYTPPSMEYLTPGGSTTVRNVEGYKNVTGFETDVSPTVLGGIERVIPLEAVLKIKEECEKHGVPWHDSAFAVSEYMDSSHPSKDIALLSHLCRSIGNDVSTIIKWYRNQTDDDNRPNKHLRPELYETHLANYPGLSDLCEIARNGFQSRVSNFTPPRPFTNNHQSAMQRSDAVKRKLVKEARTGRTLILEHDTAYADDRVNTCPYAVAPKNNVDYTVDGRLIHDGSFPIGSSVNDSVPKEKLDASTDDVKNIARRVLYLFEKFPGIPIFGMAADVDAAFQNAHANEFSALLFGGSFPDSPYVAIALTAIFGYRDSPAIFATLAKAAQFYHRSGKSDLNGVPTNFWSWVWVDDFLGIEPDLGNRLALSEHQLRSAFHLVFGSPGWNNSKYAPWSNALHAVGLDWNLMNGTVSMPPKKIEKALTKVQECLDLIESNKTPHLKTWRSLVGTLRHVGSCVPAATPFYQSFVSTEKLLIARAVPQWSTLRWDLNWFKSILNSNNLNGVTMERFTHSSDRITHLYLGWSNDSTFLMDFNEKMTIIVPDSAASLGGVLLEYHICTRIITPFAMGPFQRNDLQINLHCQTARVAQRIRNWQYQEHSLRQLGWFCTQQHVHIIASGPHFNNLNLSSYTNSFLLQVPSPTQESTVKRSLTQDPLVQLITPLEMPFVSELSNWNAPVLDPEHVTHTIVNSKHGLNFASHTMSKRTPSISSIRTFRTIFSECSLRQVAWDLDLNPLSALKRSATYECQPSKAIIKKNSILKSQKASVWTWAWKGTNERTPQPVHSGSHLVPSLCEQWESNFSKKVVPSPSLHGDAPSWGSSLSAELEKCGARSSQKTPTTSSYGKTSPVGTESKLNEMPMRKHCGLIYSSPRQKETGTRKVLRFALEKTVIRCYAPSKPYGGFKRADATSGYGTLPKAEFLKFKEEWSSIAKPTSTGSRKWQSSLGWTRLESQDTQLELEELLSSWPLGSEEQSSSSWDDGTRTAICGTYV